jgi:YesN/AraC family two-component response regulator
VREARNAGVDEFLLKPGDERRQSEDLLRVPTKIARLEEASRAG